MRRIDDNLIDKIQEVQLPIGCTFDDERRIFIKELSSCDLLAVPGSGKTTALIAKLNCLSENLEEGESILVLSHTNTAVDEIKKNLVGNAAKLLDYPHCVSTIQEFVDRFLAIPYYESKYKRSVEIIDKERYDAEIQYKLNRCFDSRVKYCSYQFDFNSVRFKVDNNDIKLVLGVEGKDISYKVPSTWHDHEEENKLFVKQWFLKVKNDILELGVLHYDDCYYLAEEYIQKYPEVINVLRKRFKYILIDETQDLQHHQLKLIDKLFYTSSCVLQRIGDPNQAIYNVVTDACCWIPRNPMYINNSLRLTSDIADVVNSFTLEKGDNGSGNAIFIVNGTKTIETPIPPVLVLYDEATLSLLKSKFKEIIESLHLQNTIEGKKYGFHIIGWNAKLAGSEFDIEKLRLENIFPNIAKVSHSTTKTYNTVSEFLQFSSNETIGECRKTILAILCRVLFLSGILDSNGRNFTKKTLPKEYENREVVLFNKALLKISLSLYQKNYAIAYEMLVSFINDNLASKFNITINEIVKNFIGEAFAEYIIEKNDDIEEIQVQIGTVHSVKGMTHCATMYVETFFHEYECKHLIKRKRNGKFLPTPFFKDTVNITTSRGKQAMKMLYVGMSRPTHLLCYASLKANWSNEGLEKMNSCGWNIMDLTI